MGLAFRNNAQRFKNPVGFPTTQIRNGMVGEYVFGDDLALSITNSATLGDLALFTGNVNPVTYTTQQAVVSNGAAAAGFSTGIYNTNDDFTFIQIALASHASIGCEHGDGPAEYWGMFGQGTNELSAWGGDYYSSIILPAAGISEAEHYFCAFRSPVTGQTSLARYSAGALQSGVTVTPPRSGKEIKIGGVISGNYGAATTAGIAYTAIYKRILSDAEIATAYAQLKAYMTDYRGIAVS